MKPAVVPGERAELIITATGHEVELSQHMTALGLANHVRLARCAARDRFVAGELDLLQVMALEECQNMKVTTLLEAQRGWGHVRAERACRAVPCSPFRRIGELTPRQRLALAREVQPHLFPTIIDVAA